MYNRPRQAVALLIIGLLTAMLLVACGDATATPAATTVAVGTSATTAAATTAAAVTTAAPATTAAVATTASGTTATTAAATTVAATTAAGATSAAATTAPGGAAAPAAVACDKPVAAATNGKTYKIGIAVQNSIPDLLSAIEGFKKGMEQCGFVQGKNVDYGVVGNALGDIPQLTAIGQDFANKKVDLIAAIGTQALVAMYNTNKDQGTPIVFNSVTNPYVAIPGVLKTETDHGPNITGIQALVNIEEIMKLILEVNPQAKNVGLLYNPGEINSKFLRDLSVEVAKKLNLNLVEASIAKSDEVLTAAQSIADKVDVFYTTTDVTVVNALPALVKVATDNKKPLIASNPTSADRGAMVASGLDYLDNGIASATKAAQILDGKKPGELAIERVKVSHLFINLKAAENIGFKIPDAIVGRAEQKFTAIKS